MLRKALEEALPAKVAAMPELEVQHATLQKESEEKLKAAEEQRAALEAKLQAAAEAASKLVGQEAELSATEAR